MKNIVKTQFTIIFKRNLLIYFRSQEYLIDLIFPVIGGIFCILANLFPQYFYSIALMCLPLTIITFLRAFIYSFVNEKFEKFKELQKIMGMKQISYVAGWLFTNYSKGLIISIIFLIITVPAGSYDTADINPWEFILIFILYMFAALHQTYCFSTFFSRPKIAADITILIQIFSTFIIGLAFLNSVSKNPYIMALLCLFPQFSVSTVLLSKGWLINKLNNESNNSFKIDLNIDLEPSTTIYMLLFDIFYYMILYYYLDAVMPNEYGTQKPLLFPYYEMIKLLRSGIRQNSTKRINQPLIQQEQQGQEFQDIDASKELFGQSDFSSAKYHEKFQNPNNLANSIIIRNLQKKFGQLNAVNNISVNLYEKQIFCLLGHNGAGKTTTISLLTGLLQKDNGQCNICGYDLDNELDEIRQNLGLCTQKDILYDYYTVEEHLYFIGQIKGKSTIELQPDVNNILQKCQLLQERNLYSQHLSGGIKRKLSLGMSLIGNSRIIFLDEPSSGMDPISRRSIWTILESLKQENRTIVLTTHHLEEAEHLADRIGIMIKGQLLTVGTSEFIKKNFGVGYHLVITEKQENSVELIQNIKRQSFKELLGQADDKKNEINLENTHSNLQQSDKNYTYLTEQKCQELIHLIQISIPGALFNNQVVKGTVQATLPFNQKNNFAQLFQTLENDHNLNISLEMNSLEDAFINIGMDENRFLDNEEENQQITKEKFTDFSQIPVPLCLQKPPKYDFFTQWLALFLRKFFTTSRSISVFVSFFLPLILQFLGVLITYIVFPGDKNQFFQIDFLCVYNVFAYCFSTSSFCGTLVMERELHLKYALNVMGCRTLPYWIGTFCFDYMMYLVSTSFFIILFYIFGIQICIDNAGSIFLMLACFGLSLIMFSYMCSFMFEKASSAYKGIPWINYLLMFCLFLLPYFIDNKFVHLILIYLSPFIALFIGFLNLARVFYQDQVVDQNVISQSVQTFLPIEHTWGYCLVLFTQAIIYALLTIILDYQRYKLLDKDKMPVNLNQNDQNFIDVDVKNEENRIKQVGNNDIIKVSNLYKQYPNGTIAINNASFGINSGEIFGLLGPNGAGKSTSFNILTSLIPKSSGSVKLQNIEVNRGIMEIYQNVGICAQFDALWENLTVEEHLMLFGRMKGLSGQELIQAKNYFINVMQLQSYINVRSIHLSGGNKRKLSVSLALIGGPNMQFFDEPSTGLDPIAKRFLWNTLTQSLKLRNSSIILTTHSMNEAESLCTKIGILINGKFYCFGSPQHLKEKFGDGYYIKVKTNLPQEVNNLVMERFPQTQQFDIKKEDELTYKFAYQNFSFYQTFQFFNQELLIEKNLILDFSISQCSLEQIFILFSSYQQYENQGNIKEPWKFLFWNCGN